MFAWVGGWVGGLMNGLMNESMDDWMLFYFICILRYSSYFKLTHV